MAAGNFLIRRNSAETDTITTSNFDSTWDTEVHNQGGTISYSAGEFTVSSAAPYLILYNERFYTSDTGGSHRIQVQGEILVNGTAIDSGKSHGYIRKTGGCQDCIIDGAAIVELSATDTVEIRFYRTDTETAGTVVRVADNGGVQVLELSDEDAYAMYHLTSSDNSDTTLTRFEWDSEDRIDAAGFVSTGSPKTTIEVQATGRYMVCFSGDITSGDNRMEFFAQVAVNSVQQEQTRASGFLRHSYGCDVGGVSGLAILDLTSGDEIELWHKSYGSGTYVTVNEMNLQIWQIPTAASEVIAEATTGDMNATADFAWDTNEFEDASVYTHVAGDANIDVDVADHYLAISNMVRTSEPASTVVERALPEHQFEIDGTIVEYGAGSNYHRAYSKMGQMNVRASAILPNLTVSQSITVHTKPLSTETGTVPTEAGQFVLLNIGAMYPADTTPGVYVIRRNASDATSLTTSWMDVAWDTEVAINGEPLHYGVVDSTFTVAASGIYLVMYSEKFRGNPTSPNQGYEIQTEINVNGTGLSEGASGTYIRATSGVQYGCVSGKAIVSLDTDDEVKIRYRRTDNTGGSSDVYRWVNTGGAHFVRLDETNDFANYSKSGTHAVTGVDFPWDTTAVEDAAFSRSGGDITLNDAGKYLVTVGGACSNASSSTTEISGQLQLNGTTISGGHSQAYMGGLNSSNAGYIDGMHVVTAEASDVLTFLSADTGSAGTISAGFSIQLWKVPDTASWAIVTAADGELHEGTSDFEWDQTMTLDGGYTFTNGDENIVPTTSGNYLAMATFGRTSVDSGMSVSWSRFRLDGSLQNHICSWSLNEGSTHGKLGFSTAGVLPGVDSGTEVSVYPWKMAGLGGPPYTDNQDAQFALLNLDTIGGVVAETHDGAGAVDVSATLVGSARFPPQVGAVSIDVSATLAADALVSKIGAGALDASASLSGYTVSTTQGSCSLGANASASADGLVTKLGVASVDVVADIAGGVTIVATVVGEFTPTATLTASPTVVMQAVGSIGVSASVSADATLTKQAVGALGTTAALEGNLTFVGGTVQIGVTASLSGDTVASMLATGSFATTISLMAADGPSALIVEDGSCVEGANSYITLDYADAYNVLRNNTDWNGTQQEKESSIIKATDYFELLYRYSIRGVQANMECLSFPRAAGTAYYDNRVEIEALPENVKKAIAELALQLLTEEVTLSPINPGVASTSTSVGSISENKSYDASGASAYSVHPRFLSGLLRSSYSGRA